MMELNAQTMVFQIVTHKKDRYAQDRMYLSALLKIILLVYKILGTIATTHMIIRIAI